MNENYSGDNFANSADRRRAGSLRNGGEWVGGAVLMLIGLLLLGKNMKIASVDNWWALFILMPALGSFSTAWRMYRFAGRFTMRARSSTLLGILLTLVTVMFLLNLSWTYLGPGMLILAGAGFLLNVLLPD
jgi:hypothetical protein